MARPAAYRHRKVQEEMKNPLLLKMKLKNKWEWHIGICNWINTFENLFKNTLRMRDAGEDFVLGHPKACLFALGSQACMILFCSSGTLMLVPSTYKTWVERFSSRCGTALKFFPCCLRTKLCGLLWGTLMLVPSTYKAWVGRFSCRCGTALKIFPYRLRTKPCGFSSPKRTNKLAGGQEQNPPPQETSSRNRNVAFHSFKNR